MNLPFRNWADSIGDWASDQEWFQQIKAKWDELDAQSRLYLKIAGAGGVVVAVLVVLFNFAWSVHALKKEVGEKSEVLAMIQGAGDELKRLREMNSSITPSAEGGQEPWAAYLENAASGAGIAKGTITISDPKTGAASEVSKEALYDITVKKVNARQLVRYAFNLQTGPRPVKLRNLMIDTQPDGTGYLDATLSVSAFTLVANK